MDIPYHGTVFVKKTPEYLELQDRYHKVREILEKFADEKNWLEDNNFTIPVWNGETSFPWLMAQEALKE